MCHRDKSVNRTEARKLFKLPEKRLRQGVFSSLLYFFNCPCFCGCVWTYWKCEHTRRWKCHAYVHMHGCGCGCEWGWRAYILPSDRSLNKLLGLPMSMLDMPPRYVTTSEPLRNLTGYAMWKSCHLSPYPFGFIISPPPPPLFPCRLVHREILLRRFLFGRFSSVWKGLLG